MILFFWITISAVLASTNLINFVKETILEPLFQDELEIPNVYSLSINSSELDNLDKLYPESLARLESCGFKSFMSLRDFLRSFVGILTLLVADSHDQVWDLETIYGIIFNLGDILHSIESGREMFCEFLLLVVKVQRLRRKPIPGLYAEMNLAMIFLQVQFEGFPLDNDFKSAKFNRFIQFDDCYNMRLLKDRFLLEETRPKFKLRVKYEKGKDENSSQKWKDLLQTMLILRYNELINDNFGLLSLKEGIYFFDCPVKDLITNHFDIFIRPKKLGHLLWRAVSRQMESRKMNLKRARKDTKFVLVVPLDSSPDYYADPYLIHGYKMVKMSDSGNKVPEINYFMMAMEYRKFLLDLNAKGEISVILFENRLKQNFQRIFEERPPTFLVQDCGKRFLSGTGGREADHFSIFPGIEYLFAATSLLHSFPERSSLRFNIAKISRGGD
jgi:hypothetical protein